MAPFPTDALLLAIGVVNTRRSNSNRSLHCRAAPAGLTRRNDLRRQLEPPFFDPTPVSDVKQQLFLP